MLALVVIGAADEGHCHKRLSRYHAQAPNQLARISHCGMMKWADREEY
jgi:hypothetical protein